MGVLKGCGWLVELQRTMSIFSGRGGRVVVVDPRACLAILVFISHAPLFFLVFFLVSFIGAGGDNG